MVSPYTICMVCMQAAAGACMILLNNTCNKLIVHHIIRFLGKQRCGSPRTQRYVEKCRTVQSSESKMESQATTSRVVAESSRLKAKTKDRATTGTPPLTCQIHGLSYGDIFFTSPVFLFAFSCVSVLFFGIFNPVYWKQ